MGFLTSLFGSKQLQTDSQNPDSVKSLPEIRQEDFVDNSDPIPQVDQLNNYGTRMPIDAIYAFISRDHEEQGYDDAMCNADSSYKESKKSMIKNELKRLFEQVGLRYKSDLRDIDVQIEFLNQQGLINTSASLKARKETYIEHMEILKNMKSSLDRDEEQLLSMVRSYERGFLKGLVAKSETLLKYERE